MLSSDTFRLFLQNISGIQQLTTSIDAICSKLPSSPAWARQEHSFGLLCLLLPPSISLQPCSQSDLGKRQADHITTLSKTLPKLPIPRLLQLKSCQGVHQVLQTWPLHYLQCDLIPCFSLLSSRHSRHSGPLSVPQICQVLHSLFLYLERSFLRWPHASSLSTSRSYSSVTSVRPSLTSLFKHTTCLSLPPTPIPAYFSL